MEIQILGYLYSSEVEPGMRKTLGLSPRVMKIK
jgi:hypothetical protein